MKTLTALCIFLSLTITPALARDKVLNWQEAQVMEISSGDPWPYHGVTYAVLIGNTTYYAREISVNSVKLKPERVKVGPVKVAFRSESVLVLLGDDGKPHKLLIMNQSHQ
jgi:hypothetical protein